MNGLAEFMNAAVCTESCERLIHESGWRRYSWEMVRWWAL